MTNEQYTGSYVRTPTRVLSAVAREYFIIFCILFCIFLSSIIHSKPYLCITIVRYSLRAFYISTLPAIHPSFTHPFVRSLVHPSINSLIHSPIHSSIRPPPIHQPTHPLIYPAIHPSTRARPFLLLSVHPFIP